MARSKEHLNTNILPPVNYYGRQTDIFSNYIVYTAKLRPQKNGGKNKRGIGRRGGGGGDGEEEEEKDLGRRRRRERGEGNGEGGGEGVVAGRMEGGEGILVVAVKVLFPGY